MGEAWLAACTKETLTARYDDLLSYAESRPDSHTARIISDLQYKKELAVRCIDYKRFYQSITYCPTHGDYQGCQLVCGDGHIIGVTDFSSARSLPVTWEIMRSYVQSDAGCLENAVIDPGDFCAYVQEYMKYSPLTKADLTSMPYVYLFQLARSRFGYTQYLTDGSDDRDELLHFAFWRTDMCREIERKADDIRSALLSI